MPFNAGPNFVKDRDGDGRPDLGGTLAVKRAAFNYTIAADTVVFTLPKGAEIVDMKLVIKTAFNAETTNTIDVGIPADDAYFANNLAAGTIAVLPLETSGWVLARVGARLAADTPVTVTYDQSGAAASAGEAVLLISYRLY